MPEPCKVFAYNRYMYVLGNPLNLVDPSGNIAICIRGGPNTPNKGENDESTPAIHTLCSEALMQAGYDKNLHGAIHYFHNNGEKAKQEIIDLILNRDAGEPAILIGHSWGGAAALEIAAALEEYGASLKAQPLANMELAAKTNIDFLMTIDAENDGRKATPTSIGSNIDIAVNVAAMNGWEHSTMGFDGNDYPGNLQNGINVIQGALNVDVEYAYSAYADNTVRMDHDTIVNVNALFDGAPTELNSHTLWYATFGIGIALR